MNTAKLSMTKRFQILLDALSPCSVLADIGSDHGKLCIAALEQEKCEYAIAADISTRSLDKARALAQKQGYESRMDFRVGNGLRVLQEGEAGSIVIAGMGGRLIANILQEAPQCVQNAECLLLQPMQQSADLRRYLREQSYGIASEWLIVENNRFCEVIQVSARRMVDYPTDLDVRILDHIGPVLWRQHSCVLREKLKWEMTIMERKLLDIQAERTKNAHDSEREMAQRLQLWQDMIETRWLP